MNKDRRNQIDAVKNRLAALQDELSSIREDIETIRDEEQEYYDNMPVSFQDGDKGNAASEAIDNLQASIDDLESLDFDAITSQLEEAQA